MRLNPAHRSFHLVVCSFMLHCCSKSAWIHQLWRNDSLKTHFIQIESRFQTLVFNYTGPLSVWEVVLRNKIGSKNVMQPFWYHSVTPQQTQWEVAKLLWFELSSHISLSSGGQNHNMQYNTCAVSLLYFGLFLPFNKKNHITVSLYYSLSCIIITAAAGNCNENQRSYDLEHVCIGLRCQSIKGLHQSQCFLEIQLRGCFHTCDLRGVAVEDIVCGGRSSVWIWTLQPALTFNKHLQSLSQQAQPS